MHHIQTLPKTTSTGSRTPRDDKSLGLQTSKSRCLGRRDLSSDGGILLRGGVGTIALLNLILGGLVGGSIWFVVAGLRAEDPTAFDQGKVVQTVLALILSTLAVGLFMCPGVIGLFAAIKENRTAAEVYLWTFPDKILYSILLWESHTSTKPPPARFLWLPLMLALELWIIKVIRSYGLQLRNRGLGPTATKDDSDTDLTEALL